MIKRRWASAMPISWDSGGTGHHLVSDGERLRVSTGAGQKGKLQIMRKSSKLNRILLRGIQSGNRSKAVFKYFGMPYEMKIPIAFNNGYANSKLYQTQLHGFHLM